MYMGVIVCVSIYSSESVSVPLYYMYIEYLCAMRVVYMFVCVCVLIYSCCMVLADARSSGWSCSAVSLGHSHLLVSLGLLL